MFGTRCCHQKWASTGGPTACFPRVERSFPRNPIPCRIRASGSNFFPWDGQPSRQRWVRSQLAAHFPAQLHRSLCFPSAGTQGCGGRINDPFPSPSLARPLPSSASLSIPFSWQDVLESVPADGRDAGAGAGADPFLPALLPVQPRREHLRRYCFLPSGSLAHSQGTCAQSWSAKPTTHSCSFSFSQGSCPDHSSLP